MKELFRLTLLLALALTLAACSSSTKKIIDDDPGTDDVITDDTYDLDATGDKDDVFAEGPVSDDAPVVGDEDGILTDTPPTDNDTIVTDDVITDDVVTDDVVTDGDIPDDGMNDDLLSDEDSIHQGEGGMTDTDVVVTPAVCAEGYVSLDVSIYHLDSNQEKVYDVAGSYTTTPVGQPTEGDAPENICYAVNSTVQIHLTANSGYTFNQWVRPNGTPANDVAGTFPDFSVSITNKPKRLSAEFTAN